MARRRWYRRSVRVVAAKKKWASNFKSGTVDLLGGADLVENSVATSSPTPVILKCGNFKVQGDVIVTATSSTGDTYLTIMAYIAFVPEGFTDTANIPIKHPEYLMGWTIVDCPLVVSGTSTFGTNKFSISSRLKRNLNSGDKVVLFYSYHSPAALGCTVRYSAQWFTCAN